MELHCGHHMLDLSALLRWTDPAETTHNMQSLNTHLQSCVDLQEIELLRVLIHQELNSTCRPVVCCCSQAHCCCCQFITLSTIKQGTGGLLKNLWSGQDVRAG